MAGSPYLVLALLLVAGAGLYGIGTLLVRSANREVPPEPEREVLLAPETPPEPLATYAAPPVGPSLQPTPWANAVTGTNDALDTATRIDIIERLVLVGEPWCIDAIKDAAESDDDADVRSTAKRALADPRGFGANRRDIPVALE